MRQIEEKMIAAINSGKSMICGNTIVNILNDGYTVHLHGNLIYMVKNNVARFTLAGWNTPTTRSRLHALGVAVNQKNYAPIYKGVEIDRYKWYNV